MRDYFRQAGYTVVEPEVVLLHELRMSSVWMYDFMPRRERDTRFLYLNTIDHRITGPVAEHLAEHVVRAARLEVDAVPIDGRPYLVAPGTTALDAEAGSWLVFNDTVDSAWFRITPGDRARLARVAEEQRREGFRIVRVGSDAERIARPDPVGIEGLDLRGRTSVMDLFRLLGSPRVAGTISFDTVVAHMGMAYDKLAIIRLRRFTTRHSRFLKQYLIPPFAAGRATDVHNV